MPIDMYFSEQEHRLMYLDEAREHVFDRFHQNHDEREMFNDLLVMADNAPFSVALVEGLVADMPMDYRDEAFLNREYKARPVTFSEHDVGMWMLHEYQQYMLMPYSTMPAATTPLYVVGREIREALAEGFLEIGAKQTKHSLQLVTGHYYGPEFDIGEGVDTLDCLTRTGSVQFGLPWRINADINPRQWMNVMEEIQWYAGKLGDKPHSYFISDYVSHMLAESVDRKKTGDMLEGFYEREKIEFIAPIEKGHQPHLG